MIEIRNTNIYGLKESVIASGYAMRLEPYDYDNEEFSKHLIRAKKLAKCGGGSGHSNFRTGIIVQFDLKYPEYLSPELQRYHWIQIVTSMSKMHRLTKMNISESCNQYVSDEAIESLNKYIDRYNEDQSYENFISVVSNCPLGLEKWERISTNYEQLATIYRQRKGHKLKEDWGYILNWIESLPYSEELITCNYNDNEN